MKNKKQVKADKKEKKERLDPVNRTFTESGGSKVHYGHDRLNFGYKPFGGLNCKQWTREKDIDCATYYPDKVKKKKPKTVRFSSSMNDKGKAVSARFKKNAKQTQRKKDRDEPV